MIAPDSPKDISKTDQLFPLSPVGAEIDAVKPAAPGFASLMQQTSLPQMDIGSSQKIAQVTPFDLVQGKAPLTQTPSATTLLAQVGQAQTTLNNLTNNINYPNLKLKAGQKSLLNSKLFDATDSLRAANAKMGAVPEETSAPTQFKGPLGRFLALLADGQTQLEAAKNQLQNLKNKGEQLSPGDFLLIQVKLNKAQQELDFSSVLLSNAVQDFKLLMQVQL